MRVWLILVIVLTLSAVGCHKKVVKAPEPMTFSETIPGSCIASFEDTSHIYCRVSQGSEVATCFLMRPVKKDTPDCKTKYIFPDYN